MSAANPRILYVDDKDCCQMIGVMLSVAEPDYELVGAVNSDEAVKLMEKEKVDLYVLEFLLPGESGIELCRRIRRVDKNTPILFYTGMVRPADRDTAMAAGATEYLIKPNDLDKLIETISKLVDKSLSISASEPTKKIYQGIY